MDQASTNGSLPPGWWVLLDRPDRPAALSIVERPASGATRVIYCDLPLALGGWSRFACFAAAWLWGRSIDPSDRIAFSWSDLAGAIGTARPSVEMSDALRRAIELLTSRSIRAGGVRLSAEPIASIFDLHHLHRRGDGQRRQRLPGSVVSVDPLFAPLLARGALAGVSLAWQREASSELVRRLALYATLVTLRPIDADGVIRQRVGSAQLLETLGVTDRRADRRARRLTDAIDELTARDARFAGSDGRATGGEILLARSLPLLARQEL